MKKKISISVIVVLLLIASVGGGVYMFKQKEKEAQVVEWEKVAAKQIKNTFANIEEIHFSEKYRDNWLAGFVSIGADIVTSETKDSIGFSLPPDDETSLESYGGGTSLKDGKTETKVKVIYSDLSEEEI